MVRRVAEFFAIARVVVDHKLDGIEHRDAALGAIVQVLTHAILDHRIVDP